MMSNIIAGKVDTEVREVNVAKPVISLPQTAMVTVLDGNITCNDKEKSQISNNNVGEMINSIIENQSKGGKTVIKIQIEITKE